MFFNPIQSLFMSRIFTFLKIKDVTNFYQSVSKARERINFAPQI